MSPYHDPRPSTASAVLMVLVTALLAALSVALIAMKPAAE